MSIFYPLSDTVVKDIESKIFVFDVETRGLSARPESFIFGCMYGKNFRKIFYTVEEFKKEFSLKKYKHKYIFAHNAEYDLTTIYDNILKNLDSSAIFNNRFIMARKNEVRFCDSFNILPAKLSAIGKIIGIEKLELHDKFKTGSKNIRVTKKDIEYCFRDCEIVYEALLKIFSISGDIKPTIAGLSMNFFRRKYLDKSIVNKEQFDNYFYESYYGGRVECFKIGKTYSYKYDVNSMYPYVMSKMYFPCSENLKIKSKVSLTDFKHYLKNYEGCANVTVEHIKTDFGYLPYRSEEGKLTFPYGVFTGTWNFNELRFAIDQNIVKVKKINFVIYSKRVNTIFREFVRDVYHLRHENKDTIEGYIYKLFLNSLYGRFGQKEKIKTVWLKETDIDFFKKLDEQKTRYEIKHYNKNRTDILVSLFYKSKNHYSIPSIASYITSEARIELLKLFIKYKGHRITYCDTDCIAVEKKIVGLNNTVDLGALKLENSVITKISGNKYYSEVTDNKHSVKIKGIPNEHDYINDHYYYNKLVKTKESIRRNIDAGQLIKVKKKLSGKYDKRTISENNSNTQILYINERQRN